MEEGLFPEESPKVTKYSSREKNLISLCILLVGLFVGSLFVDFMQLVTGSGFSSAITKKYNVLETESKTWVGYIDPKVSVQVITDQDCTACDPNEALVWLRRVIPTIEATRLQSTDELSQGLIGRFGIATVPAFIFSKDVLYTSFYSQASSLFASDERKDKYFFDMSKIGLPVGKYLRLPKVEVGDISFGSESAKVTVIEFSDFSCLYCKEFHQTLVQTIKSYGDQVRVIYKNLPLGVHPQAENAALASLCAHAQGKFDVYSEYLFAKQADWNKSSGTQKFKDYAWYLKLNGRDFATCIDSKQYIEKINGDREEADHFSISATPATFINETFISGAITPTELKQVIDEELAK